MLLLKKHGDLLQIRFKKKNNKKKNWKRAWNMDKISIFDYNVENVPKVEEYSVC